MNNKIPYHELAILLAGKCNITPAEAENFIKSFFDQLTRSLIEGETVKIKGIGIFSPSSDAENPVIFTPDAEIADAVNAPFSMFEPEEVSDSLSNEAFEEVDTTSTSEDEPEDATELPTESPQTTEAEPVQEAAKEVSPQTGDDTKTEAPLEVASVTEKEAAVKQPQPAMEATAEPTPQTSDSDRHHDVNVQATEPTVSVSESTFGQNTVEDAQKKLPAAVTPVTPKQESVPHPLTPGRPVTTPSYPDEEPEEYLREPEQKSGAGFGWGFVIGLLVGLAIGACGVYFAIDYLFPTMTTSSSDIEAEENIISATMSFDSVAAPLEAAIDTTAATAAASAAASADTIRQPLSEPEPAPVATPVKDTVRPGYLLNDMAKKHYGNKCFWVYIYEENKAKIANPNRVGPGLVLVIPPAEKYGIDSSSQASIKAANEKAGKILTKYPK